MTTDVLAVVLAVVFGVAGIAKISGAPVMRTAARHLGFSVDQYRVIGALELAGAVGLALAAWTLRDRRPALRATARDSALAYLGCALLASPLLVGLSWHAGMKVAWGELSWAVWAGILWGVLVSAFIGWIVYNETLSPLDWIGAAAIATALVLVRLPARRAGAAPQNTPGSSL